MPRRPLPDSDEWRARRRALRTSRRVWTLVAFVLLLLAAGFLVIARSAS